MKRAAKAPRLFGYREDGFQKELERTVGDLCGFEEALFVPTCTIANQIAIRIWCSPGEAILATPDSHLALVESQATSALTGTVIETEEGKRGHLEPLAAKSRLKAARDDAARKIALVWLENTHMRAGGTTMPKHWQEDIARHCADANVALHLDGSRLWNTSVAQNLSLSQLCKGAQSVAISLNKGLGAPVGSLLAGSSAFIREAVRVRQMFGATWRPIGILAAAGLGAIQNYQERMASDHKRAKAFADGLRSRELPGLQVETPDTNIVLVTLPQSLDPIRLVKVLSDDDILVLHLGGGVLRFVTHAAIDDADIQFSTGKIARAVSKALRESGSLNVANG
jgi:threonine aldolase